MSSILRDMYGARKVSYHGCSCQIIPSANMVTASQNMVRLERMLVLGYLHGVSDYRLTQGIHWPQEAG